VRSAVEAILGDSRAALETQITFARGVADTATEIPGVGLALASIGAVVGGSFGAVVSRFAFDVLQTGISYFLVICFCNPLVCFEGGNLTCSCFH